MVSSAGQRSQVRLVLRLTLYWWIASKHVTYIDEHSESAPRLTPLHIRPPTYKFHFTDC